MKSLETPRVMYAKVYEGLTIEGMLAHIANAIILWGLGKHGESRGTQNDCQLILNFVLRAYHRRMLKEGLYGKIPSKPNGYKAFKNKAGYHLEHAIPIACIMWALFNNVTSRSLPKAIRQVREVLSTTMMVAYVSTPEHDRLNKDFSCTMPDGLEYPWAEVWARYKRVGLPIPKLRD